MAQWSRWRWPQGRAGLGLAVLLVLVALTVLTTALALGPGNRSAGPGNGAGAGPAPASSAQRPLQVLLIGDSLADGAYATTQAAGFGSIVRAELARQEPVELTTVAVPGITAGRILAHVPRGRAFDVVVVEAGTNDAGRTGVQGFEADYAALLDALRAQSRDAVLVCLGAWGRPAAVGDYDDAVASQCRRQDGTFRPLGQLYEDNRWEGGVMPDGRKVDDFHPNDAGHALIAGQVLDALRSR